MQTTFHQPSPAFPPVDDLLSFLTAIPWRRIGSGVLGATMAAAALAYCLGQRARRAVGPTAAEALRAMADAVDVPPAPTAAERIGWDGIIHADGQTLQVTAVGPTPAERLAALPVRQLRILARQAGHRALARSGRRADLLEALTT